MKKGQEFAQGIAKAGEQKVETAVHVVEHPFGTLLGIPLGASRFFGGIGEGLKGGHTEGEGNLVQNVSGVEKAKVALAVKLGVSPYSYNQELQKELTANARAIALGGLVVSAATAVAGGPAGTALSALNVNETLQQALVNTNVNDLRILNRKKLFALGMSRENVDEFLMHPWYSPWSTTIIVDSLSKVGVDPTEFVALACKALTEEDATYFQRLSQVMAAYAERKAPLRSIRVVGTTVAAMDTKGNIMVPLSCDYAIWSQVNAGKCNEFVKRMHDRPEPGGILLWIDGKTSDEALKGAKALNIEVATEVLNKK